jgi:hypothetical protein
MVTAITHAAKIEASIGTYIGRLQRAVRTLRRVTDADTMLAKAVHWKNRNTDTASQTSHQLWKEDRHGSLEGDGCHASAELSNTLVSLLTTPSTERIWPSSRSKLLSVLVRSSATRSQPPFVVCSARTSGKPRSWLMA